jgi:hypothetical protein
MRSRFRLVAALLGCTIVIGCRETTAPPLGELAVTGTPATIRQPLWGQFAVDVTLRNVSASPIRVFGCGPAAERETAGDWDMLVEPMCALAGDDFELEPMTERTVRANISALIPISPGRYRLVYRFWTVGVWGDAQEARSAPIEVVE